MTQSPVRQSEFGLEDRVEIAGPEHHQLCDMVSGTAVHDIAGLQLPQWSTVDNKRRRSMPGDLESDDSIGVEYEGAVKQHVRRNWGEKNCPMGRLDDWPPGRKGVSS